MDYAAAMSAAQEKVTGSSKLDMAGIMAALAMAKTRGEAGDTRLMSDINGDVKVKTQAPQQSFLHNKFKKVKEMKPVHIPITVEREEKVKEERGQVVRAESMATLFHLWRKGENRKILEISYLQHKVCIAR